MLNKKINSLKGNRSYNNELFIVEGESAIKPIFKSGALITTWLILRGYKSSVNKVIEKIAFMSKVIQDWDDKGSCPNYFYDQERIYSEIEDLGTIKDISGLKVIELPVNNSMDVAYLLKIETKKRGIIDLLNLISSHNYLAVQNSSDDIGLDICLKRDGEELAIKHTPGEGTYDEYIKNNIDELLLLFNSRVDFADILSRLGC